MKKLRGFLTALSLLLIISPIVSSQPPIISEAMDFSWEADSAKKEGVPLLVLFSANECIYCEKLFNEVLKPEIESGKLAKQAHLSVVNIDLGGKLIDFDGDPVRRRIFVERYNIVATPTIILMDYKGSPLGKPLVGFGNGKKYPEQLDRAIDSAAMGLAALNWPKIAKLLQ